MSTCIDETDGELHSETCFEESATHVFVYTWRADNRRSHRPTGADYQCGVTVHRRADCHGLRCENPVRQHVWFATAEFWESDIPSPCETRDDHLAAIRSNPEGWVG